MSTTNTAPTHCFSDSKVGLWMTKYFRWACVFHRPSHMKDEPMDVLGCLRTFAPKLLLEVCGAAGAVWGSSECYRLRNDSNTDEVWRPLCWMTSTFYSLRFHIHSKHFLEHGRDYPPIKVQHRRQHWMTFFQIFSTKFLLEVLGATGAVWGSMEALTLRNDTNVEQWRTVAIMVGLGFLARWICLALSYCLFSGMLWIHSTPTLTLLARWMDLIVAKFVLEVLGAAGAAWGFSEIVKLRTPDTMHSWRPVSVVAGFIFLLRWVWQLRSTLWEERHREAPMPPVGPKNTTAEETNDLELGDLVFRETVETKTANVEENA